jgi:hypothetical protein
LMAAGAQEAPAPQNFNQGGAVQSFALGGIAMPSAFVPMLNEDQGAPSSQAELLMGLRNKGGDPASSKAELLMGLRNKGGDPALLQAELLKDLMSTGDGSAGSLKSYYNEMLPIYQEVLGQTDEDRNMAKGQAYFDVAQAGLALASGVDPPARVKTWRVNRLLRSWLKHLPRFPRSLVSELRTCGSKTEHLKRRHLRMRWDEQKQTDKLEPR